MSSGQSSAEINFRQKQSQRILCVVSPEQNAYSQTFVRAHKKYLPATVKSLHTNDYETLADDSGPLVRPELSARLSRAMLRRSLNLSPQYFQQHALRRFLARNKVEAVLAEFGPTATLVMEACKKMRVPLVAHFHGFDAYRRSTLESYSSRYTELFEAAAALIAVSRDMQAQLVSLGAPAPKIHYNSCGVDPSMFKGANPLHSSPTFVAIGRFVNKKAPHLTLLAFKRTLGNVPEARLLMIGDGPLWEACDQMRRSLGLSGSVELLGRRSQAEVAAVMKKARAFVQHSITTHDGDSEGTPVAVLEACASGLPVVATRHAGIKDAVIHEKTGFLVNEGDINSMAEKMTQLARQPQLAADLGKAGREWVSSEYSMDRSITRLWNIIEGTMAHSSSA
jgi:glycosyltransferase involved in cell wall biosynthesis